MIFLMKLHLTRTANRDCFTASPPISHFARSRLLLPNLSPCSRSLRVLLRARAKELISPEVSEVANILSTSKQQIIWEKRLV